MQPNRSAPPLVEMCPRKREGAAADGGRGLHSKRDEMDGCGQSGGGGGLANSEQLPLPLQLPKGIAPLPSSPPSPHVSLQHSFSPAQQRSLPSPSSARAAAAPLPTCRQPKRMGAASDCAAGRSGGGCKGRSNCGRERLRPFSARMFGGDG